MSVGTYSMEVEVGKELFYGEESLFGIYSVKPTHYQKLVRVNNWGSISLQGTTRRLKEGEKYEIKFEGGYTHPKHGEFFKIIEVEQESLKTVNEQDNFLKAVIADNHFKSLKKAYPNELLVDLILAGKVDVKKTKGVKEKTLNKIKEAVKMNAGISVLLAKLTSLGLTTGRVERILKHFGDTEKALSSIENDIFSLCEVQGFGFLTVDKSATLRGDSPTNKKRIVASISYLLKKDNQNGHTYSYKKDIIKDSVELLGIEIEYVLDAIDGMKAYKDYYIDSDRIAFDSIREKEKQIYKHLKRIQNNYKSPAINDIEEKIKEIECRQGFEFTDEQNKAIAESVQCGVYIVSGFGGTGKSSIVKGLVDVLGYPLYRAVALSGKASKILSSQGLESSTIHRMLGRDKKTGGFLYNNGNKLPFEMVILDEASMVNIDLFLSIIQSIESGSKIVITGDSGQLPPIGTGEVFTDLLQVGDFPKRELTKVHRQAEKSGILSTANKIRLGEQIIPYDFNGKEVFGELQDQTIVGFYDSASIIHNLLQVSRMYKEKHSSMQDLLDFQVITPNRERGSLSVRNINIELQKIFNGNDKPCIDRNGYSYKSMDKVISQGNSYDRSVFEDEFAYFDAINNEDIEEDEEGQPTKQRTADVFNGTLGWIVDISVKEKIVFVQFEDIDGIVVYTQDELEKLDLAYCISVHKSQGSSSPFLIVAFDMSSFMLLSRQLAYTAVSRGSGKSLMLVESKAMHKAIQTNASMRRTFLKEILDTSMTKS